MDEKEPAPAAPRGDDDEQRAPSPDPPPPGDEGLEMPIFAQRYPRDPALDELLAAFARGDYRRVRDEAPRLADSAADPLVARAARDLRARLDPDPLAVWMLAGMAALLLFLVVWFYAHAHEHPLTAVPPAAPARAASSGRSPGERSPGQPRPGDRRASYRPGGLVGRMACPAIAQAAFSGRSQAR